MTAPLVLPRRIPRLRWLPIIRHGANRLREAQWRHGPGIGASDAAGRPYEVDHIIVERLLEAPPLAAELGAGVVWERSRRYLLDGTPVQLAWSWFPGWLVRKVPAITRQDTGPGGVFARMAEVPGGYAPVRFQEAISLHIASEGEAVELGIAAGAPVFQIVRHSTDGAGRFVEVSRIVATSKYTLVYEMGS